MALKSSVREVVENGIVLEKILRKAFDGFTDTRTGKQVEGKGERYTVVVVSSSNFSDVNGYTNGTYLEYTVPVEVGKNLCFGSPVQVSFEMTNNGSKALDLVPLSDKKDKKTA